jgi:hypothetical protein
MNAGPTLSCASMNTTVTCIQPGTRSRQTAARGGCALAAVAVAAVLGACGGSSGNGVAAKQPAAIIGSAIQAIRTVNTVRLSGSLTQHGLPVSIDLKVASGRGASGVVSIDRLPVRLVEVGSTLYLNAGSTFWSRFGSGVSAQALAGKWLKAPTSSGGLAPFAALTDPGKILSEIRGDQGSLSKGTTTKVDGQKVIGVHDATSQTTLYVATTGKPYPVAIDTGGTSRGRVMFERGSFSVPLTPPATVVDLSQVAAQ